jgi:hypothetical protein
MGGLNSRISEPYEEEEEEELEENDKGWSEEVSDGHGCVVPHITKFGISKYHGMYNQFYPPRIGIDFYGHNQGDHKFISNLDIGDVARLVRVLELAQKYTVFDKLRSGKIRPFEIGLSFQGDLNRKVELDAESSHLILKYHGFHRENLVEFTHRLSREGAEKLINVLKKLVVEYVSVIQKYVMTGEVDERFR